MGRKVEEWIGWTAGGLITVGILVSHLLAPRVPKGPALTHAPIVVCSTAPRGALESATQAVRELRKRGFVVGDVNPGVCGLACGSTCVPGAVVIDVASADLYTADEHGRCIRPEADPTWGRIELSSEVLPGDAQVLLIAHEIAHCSGGYGHARGALNLSAPTGHLMNPRTQGMGWSTAGMK